MLLSASTLCVKAAAIHKVVSIRRVIYNTNVYLCGTNGHKANIPLLPAHTAAIRVSTYVPSLRKYLS